MKQVIVLEPVDMDLLRKGSPLAIRIGDNFIELVYKGINNTYSIEKWTCPSCAFTCHPQGKGPHIRMHKRNKNGVKK
jgi:hypothetical protein